jgi:ABC-2 type transport system permease protein
MDTKAPIVIGLKDLELLARDPVVPTTIILMPLAISVLIRPALGPVLHSEGYPRANGAEQAVPGMALMFGLFIVSYGGQSFFREYVWGTWQRMRALPVVTWQVMVGKMAPFFIVLCLQQVTLFTAGAMLLGLDVKGSIEALVIVDFVYILWVLSFMLATVAFCRTFQQVLAVSNLGALLLGALGGTLTSFAALPDWAKTVAHATPTYWAMHGFNEVILNGKGLSAIASAAAVLAASALAIFVVAARRFDVSEEKTGTVS